MADFANAFGGGSPGKIGTVYIGQYDTFGDLPAAANFDEGTVAWVRGSEPPSFYYVDTETWVALTLGEGVSPTANEILNALQTVDGAGSLLDADKLDGLEGSAYATAAQGALADSAVQPGDPLTDLASTGATSGYVPTADGAGGIDWAAQAGGSSGGPFSDIVHLTTNTTIGVAGVNKVYRSTSNITVTLNDLASDDYSGGIVRIVATGASNTITVKQGTNVIITPNMDSTTADDEVKIFGNSLYNEYVDFIYAHQASAPRTWYAVSPAGPARHLNTKTLTTAYTCLNEDMGKTLLCTSALTITTEDSVRAGWHAWVVNISGGVVDFTAGSLTTVSPSGVTLDNSGSLEVSAALLIHRGGGTYQVIPVGPTDPDDYVAPGADADTLGSGAATDGQVLTADGAGNAAWETPAADAGNITLEVETTNAYTPVLADKGKLKQVSDGTAATVTIPPNSSVAFSTGDMIAWTQGGAGTVSFAAGSGVIIRSANSLLDLAYQWSTATTIYLGSDVWLLSGDLA